MICVGERSNIIWLYDGGGRLLKPSEYRIWGRVSWPNRHITFIVDEKA